jgi:hypothetical protein
LGKPSIYLESTVISFYANRRSRNLIVAAYQEITAEWWETELPKYDAYISDFVIQEISRGDPRAAAKRLAAAEPFVLLEIPDQVEQLATRYLSEIVIPRRSHVDAFHIATAVVNGMDYIVTWNFHHISNVFVKEKIRRINDMQGVETPTICTPEELAEDDGGKYEE